MAVERERAVLPPRPRPELELLRELPGVDAWAGSSLDGLFRELRWRLADPEALTEFLRQVPAWQRQAARLALVAACAGSPGRLAWAQRLANDALGAPARAAGTVDTPRHAGSYAERYDALRAETVEAALLRQVAGGAEGRAVLELLGAQDRHILRSVCHRLWRSAPIGGARPFAVVDQVTGGALTRISTGGGGGGLEARALPTAAAGPFAGMPVVASAPVAVLRAAVSAEEIDKAGAKSPLAKLATAGGVALPRPLRLRMERVLRSDLSMVRVNVGGDAAQAARALNAHALTVGTVIHFAAGKFAPNTAEGDRLLLHELTHVVQHNEGRLPRDLGMSKPGDAVEVEAHATVERLAPVLARLPAEAHEGAHKAEPEREPVEEKAKRGEPPVEAKTKRGEPPVEAKARPGEPPVEAKAKPGEPTVEEKANPGEPAVEAKAKPEDQNKPVGEKAKPVEEKAKPVEEKAKPVEEKAEPDKQPVEQKGEPPATVLDDKAKLVEAKPVEELAVKPALGIVELAPRPQLEPLQPLAKKPGEPAAVEPQPQPQPAMPKPEEEPKTAQELKQAAADDVARENVKPPLELVDEIAPKHELAVKPELEAKPPLKPGQVVDGHGLGLLIEPQLQPDDPKHQGKFAVDPTLHLVDPKKAEAIDPTAQPVDPQAKPGQPAIVDPKLPGLELKSKQNVEHDHEQDHAQTAQPLGPAAHGGGAPMAQPPTPKPTQPPAEMLANNQTALNAYIAKCEAERAKAKDKVQQQKLAKTVAAQIDAKAIAARVKAANDAKLAKLRADAQHDKVATAQTVQQQKQEGQVTVESLKAKLEDKLTADKQKFKDDFEQKKQELTLRLQTQKETLAAESKAQLDNLRTQQKARLDDANKKWEAEKEGFKKQAEELMVQMRHQMDADKTKLADQQQQTMKLASDKAAAVEKDANDKADDLIKKGDTKAQDAYNRCAGDGNSAYAAAQAQADKEDDLIRRAQILTAGSVKKKDFVSKGELSSKDIKAKAAAEAQKMRDLGAAQKKKVIDAAANQVKAIDDKINALAGLAQKRVAENEKALQAKLKAGQDAIDKQIGELQKTIDKKQKEADDKIKKLEDDGGKKLQADYDKELKVIDQKANVARQALAHGSQKNIAQLEKLVDSTLTSIDKSIADTQKKLDATIASAEKQAAALVMAALKSIKAEADKILVAIDKEYDAQLKAVQDAVDATKKHIDESAQGKMLEIEVHVATMFADVGQKDRLAAVKKQLEWYVRNNQTPPKGFGEMAPPPEPAPGSDKKGEAAAQVGPKSPQQEADEKKKKDEAEAARRADLDPEEREKEDAEKAKQETLVREDKGADKAKKPATPPEPTDEEVDAKVQELMKKGQTATTGAAAAAASATVQGAYDASRHAINHVVNQKMSEIENLEKGGTDPQLEQFKVDQKAGQDAADAIATAANREGFWGKDPDKKAIMKALEGKTPAQIEALRAALLAKSPPINIDDLINNELSGDEQKEAKIRMTGDPIAGDIQGLLGSSGWKPTGNEKTGAVVAGAVIAGPVGAYAAGALVDAFSGSGVDKERLEEILARYPDPKDRAKFAEAFEKQTGLSFNDFLKENIPDEAEKYKAEKTPEALEKEQAQADLLKQAQADAAAGKIDVKGVGTSVDKLRDALDNFHVDGTRADMVAQALEGKSPAEVALIMAEFKKRPGNEDLEAKLRTMLSGPALAQAEATLKNDPEQIAVSKLMGAEQSSWTPWTVDDKKLQDTLEGLTDPEARRRVLAMYKAQTGVDLSDVIAHKMSGNDRKLAQCLADGDELGAAMVKMDEASNGGWLNAMQDAASERFGIPKDVSKGITNVAIFGLGGAAMPEGKSVTVDGYVIGDGGIHKVDSDAIMKIMASVKDPADREKLALMYKQATGKDLDADMKAKLGGGDPLASGAKYDQFQALMAGDYDKAAACAAKAALSDGILQDKDAFYKQLEGKSEWERQRIMAAFNGQYGNGDANAFKTFYNDHLDGLDAKKAYLLAEGKDDPATGTVKLPPKFELEYAMDSVWVKAAHMIDGGTKSADKFFEEHPGLRLAVGIATFGQSEVMLGEAKAASWMMSNWGVDDEKVLAVLREHPELAQTLDPKLKAEIQYTLSGRSLNEAQYYLDHGVPQTPEEKLKFQMAMYQFDRGGSNSFSQGFTDLFSVSGKDYDAQYQEMLLLQAQVEQCQKAGLPIPPELAAQMAWTTGMSSATGEQYDQDKAKVANTAAQAVGVVVGAVVTALTGGVAGAILGALAAGLATIGTKAAIMGDSYKKGELGVDIAMTLVNAVTAGVLKAEPLAGFVKGLKFLSAGGQQMLNAVLGGAGAAALSSMVQTMLTSKDAHDLLGLLGQGAKAGLWAAITGGANAAAMHALNGLMNNLTTKLLGTNATDELGKAFRKPGLIEAMITGYVAGGGGAMASMAVEAMADPAVLRGSWDTVLANALQRFHEGGFQNAMQTGADHIADARTAAIKEAVEAAKKAQAEGASPEAQREAFAQKMAEAAQAESAAAGKNVDGTPIAELGGQVQDGAATPGEHEGKGKGAGEHEPGSGDGAEGKGKGPGGEEVVEPIKGDKIIEIGGGPDGEPIKGDKIIDVGGEHDGAAGKQEKTGAPEEPTAGKHEKTGTVEEPPAAQEKQSASGKDAPLGEAQAHALDAALEKNAHMATADEGSCNVTTHSLGERIATATNGEVLPEVHGVDHKFLKAGGQIIDPTFHQFFEGLPAGIEPAIFSGSKAELVQEIQRLLASGGEVSFDGVPKSELTPEKLNGLVEKYWPDSAPNGSGNPDQMYVQHTSKGDKYFYGDYEQLPPEAKAKCEPLTPKSKAAAETTTPVTGETPTHTGEHVPGEPTTGEPTEAGGRTSEPPQPDPAKEKAFLDLLGTDPTLPKGKGQEGELNFGSESYREKALAEIQAMRENPETASKLGGLSDVEALALKGYTEADYEILNHALRGDPETASQLAAYTEMVGKALDGLPPYEGTVVRKASFSPEQIGQLFPEGGTFADPAFLSSSVPGEGTGRKGNVTLEIESQSGRDVSFLSTYGNEKEVLFKPGTEFHVVEKTFNPETGEWHIKLAEGPGGTHAGGGTESTQTGAGKPEAATEKQLIEAANKSHIVERANAALEKMPVEERGAYQKLLTEAENPTQKVMLERALAAGSSAEDLAKLADYMKGYSEAEILKRFTGADVVQFFQESCVPTALQAARAQVDPLYAFKLVMDPVFAAQEQFKALQETGGRTEKRAEGDYDKKINALLEKHPDLKEFLADPSNFKAGTTGIEPALMKGNTLLENLQKATGVQYEVLTREGMSWKNTGDGQFKLESIPHDRIQAALERGLPVPFSANGHEQLIIDCFEVGGEKFYVVHDPMSGATGKIAAKYFDMLPMLKMATVMLPAEAARSATGKPESGAPITSSEPTLTGGRSTPDDVKKQFGGLGLSDEDAAKLADLSSDVRKVAAEKMAQGKSVEMAIKLAEREVQRTDDHGQTALDAQVKKNLAEFSSASGGKVKKPENRAFIDPATEEGMRNFRRASDLDRGLDDRAVEEARDMDRAERAGELGPPVERSTRPGADVVSGSGADTEHWSMKDIRDNEGPDQYQESLDRSLKELRGLVAARLRGEHSVGLIVNLRYASAAGRAAARQAIEQAVLTENGRLMASSDPKANKEPLPVVFLG